MNISTLRYVSRIAAAAVIFAGCSGGSQSQLAPSEPIQQNAVQAGMNVRSLNRRRSWMDPDAKKVATLLYVSDAGTNEVYVYKHPLSKHMKLVGTLTGFTGLRRECVDKAGDVWIADTGASKLFEYAHGGTSPINTLNISGQYSTPEGCSVNMQTGDLAVPLGDGAVWVYPNAKGTPTIYSPVSDISYVFNLGYDNEGNLFVDGINMSSAYLFAELPKGASAFTNVVLNQSFCYPGPIEWDGKHITISDNDCDEIYRFTFSESSGAIFGKVVGSTPLTGAAMSQQYSFLDHKVIVSEYGEDGGAGAGIWNYPTGGSSTKSITGSFGHPIGTAISKR